MNRSGHPRLTAAFLTAVTALFAGLVLASGCTKPDDTKYDEGNKTQEKAADPWEAAGKRLRKETEPGGVRTVLSQLSNDLSSQQGATAPAPLSDAAAAELAALARLTPPDVESIRSAGYGGLDPAYVAECLYLRDAARAVDPVGLPPAELARAGFAWVCRQVYLEPWLLEVRPGVFQGTALPPTYVLRRGYGSGLERAYVFLALLQQMGLDGCLIGTPDAATRHAGYVALGADNKPLTGSPKGPFWAVGVRVGADILLFEPWKGQPFPGPDGKGVGTLAQVKANPDVLKPWFEDKSWGVTADDVKKGVVFLAVPTPAFAPRLALLDEKLKAALGLWLAIDAKAFRDRFLAAAPNGPGLPASEVAYWNPPGDDFAYGRTLATFLPAEEGGTDRAEPKARLSTLYQQSLVPPSVYQGQDVIPRELEQQLARDRLVKAMPVAYAAAFLVPPTPRERMQRGQIQDATRSLADSQDRFVRRLESLRSADPKQLAAWVQAANAVYAELRQARFPTAGQLQALPDADPGVAAALGRVEEFWRAQSGPAQVIIDRASARIGLAEASFLLALAKHEEAERQQLRAERASAADAARAKAAADGAWAEAANTWRSYLDQSAALPGFPGRGDHARALAARADALAARK